MSFQEFYELVVRKYFDEDFIKYLNSRNKRALIKRLADFFEVQKRRYS